MALRSRLLRSWSFRALPADEKKVRLVEVEEVEKRRGVERCVFNCVGVEEEDSSRE